MLPARGALKKSDSAPLVTVGISTHNRAEMLVECIRSVLEQDYSNLEIIVSDNASSDCTSSTVLGIGDSRIRYLRSERPLDRGCEVFQIPLSAARGVYYKPQADDDLMAPDCISKCVHLLESQPEVVVVLLGTQEFGDRLRYRTPVVGCPTGILVGEHRHAVLPRIQAIPIGTNMYRRDVAIGVGGYANLGPGAWSADFDLLVRLIDAGGVGVLDSPLFWERTHSGQERFRRRDRWKALANWRTTMSWYVEQAPTSAVRRRSHVQLVRGWTATWGQEAAYATFAGRPAMLLSLCGSAMETRDVISLGQLGVAGALAAVRKGGGLVKRQFFGPPRER